MSLQAPASAGLAWVRIFPATPPCPHQETRTRAQPGAEHQARLKSCFLERAGFLLPAPTAAPLCLGGQSSAAALLSQHTVYTAVCPLCRLPWFCQLPCSTVTASDKSVLLSILLDFLKRRPGRDDNSKEPDEFIFQGPGSLKWTSLMRGLAKPGGPVVHLRALVGSGTRP